MLTGQQNVPCIVLIQISAAIIENKICPLYLKRYCPVFGEKTQITKAAVADISCREWINPAIQIAINIVIRVMLDCFIIFFIFTFIFNVHILNIWL